MSSITVDDIGPSDIPSYLGKLMKRTECHGRIPVEIISDYGISKSANFFK